MLILGIEQGSVGEELGIKKGDKILSFDRIKVTDFLDYEYYNAQENFILSIKKENGQVQEFEIEKDYDEDLGFVLDTEIPIRQCANKCIFCFVDQLPKEELRSTLKIRDDDYRHSFLNGTYVTLTNLSRFDIDRIKRLELSPLYISVHATDLKTRNMLLGNDRAKEIMPILKELSDSGIIIHAQIVYCPTFNDDLEKYIFDLSTVCESLAVIPVGLTKDSNPVLVPVDARFSKRVVEICEKCAKVIKKQKGTNFVWAADEFYVKSKTKVQDLDYYEECNQFENGVGMLASFNYDFDNILPDVIEFDTKTEYIIATGESAYDFLKEKSEFLNKNYKTKIEIYKIKNEFFGETVTVAGLLTGRDIIKNLYGRVRNKTLLIPSVMLREFTDVFLDGTTLKTLETELNVKIKQLEPFGNSFVSAVSLKINKSSDF